MPLARIRRRRERLADPDPRANEIAQSKGKKAHKPFNYEREQLQKQERASAAVTPSTPSAPATPAAAAPAKTRKLSFKDQRELDGLPAAIAALEAEQQAIAEALADGSLFASDNARAMQLSARNAQIDDELMVALERWEELGRPA
jgi:ATP-binding cassette subfamily F protein uup